MRNSPISSIGLLPGCRLRPKSPIDTAFQVSSSRSAASAAGAPAGGRASTRRSASSASPRTCPARPPGNCFRSSCPWKPASRRCSSTGRSAPKYGSNTCTGKRSSRSCPLAPSGCGERRPRQSSLDAADGAAPAALPATARLAESCVLSGALAGQARPCAAARTALTSITPAGRAASARRTRPPSSLKSRSASCQGGAGRGVRRGPPLAVRARPAHWLALSTPAASRDSAMNGLCRLSEPMVMRRCSRSACRSLSSSRASWASGGAGRAARALAGASVRRKSSMRSVLSATARRGASPRAQSSVASACSRALARGRRNWRR